MRVPSAFAPLTTQSLSIGAASQVTAQPVGVTRIRLVATSACFVAFGTAPVADTTGMYLAPNVPEVMAISSAFKVAVIQSAVAGTLYITNGV